MHGMRCVSITPTECNSGWGWVLCRFALHMEEHVQGCSCRKLHVELHNSLYTHVHVHMCPKSLCTICSTMLSYQNAILVVWLVDVIIKYVTAHLKFCIWRQGIISLPSIPFSFLHFTFPPSFLPPSLPPLTPLLTGSTTLLTHTPTLLPFGELYSLHWCQALKMYTRDVCVCVPARFIFIFEPYYQSMHE